MKRRIQTKNKAYLRNSWRSADTLLSSFKYAFKGIVFGFTTQRNFRIHCLLGSLAFLLGVFLNLKLIDLALLVLVITAVLVLELLNTALEAVVNLSVGRRFHPLAQVAKDCAAASVLVASISSLLIACLLLLPPIFAQMGFFS